MDKVSDKQKLLWYASETVDNGWTRDVLVHQIKTDLYKRQVAAPKVSNFGERLPSPQSELAIQTMKDPYIFEIVDLARKSGERDIENALVRDVTRLLLEFGTGFAFIGNQYHIEVGGEDFYIDLLFYNLKLRCYVVVELKTGQFRPEHAGKLNFYLSAVDAVLKTEHDNPTIGYVLCGDKNNVIAEYALKDISKPVGVSEYQIVTKIPKEFENILPSAEDIKTRIKFE